METTFWTFVVRWRDWNGDEHEVKAFHPDRDTARANAEALATEYGWTPRRWWQWWRWTENR